MTETSIKKILFGTIHIGEFRDNLFAMKLIEKLSKIVKKSGDSSLEQSRSVFLVNFIQKKSAFDLFIDSALKPTMPRISKDNDVINLGFFTDESIDIDTFNFFVDKLGHIPVNERGRHLMQMALVPAMADESNAGYTLDLFSERACEVSKMLKASTKEQSIQALYHGAIFESLKSKDSTSVSIGTVVFDESSLKPKNADGKNIDVELEADRAERAVALLNAMSPENMNLFMVRAIVDYMDQSHGLFFRKENNLPYLFSDKKVGAISLNLDGPIPNSFIEVYKSAYNLKNNRIKDRFGASDASMLIFKNNINSPVRDPATAMLVRIYTQYPELLKQTLPKEVDIRGVIQYIGGSDRSLGVYIGRNPFTAHRYLTKKQDRPQHIELLLELFAKFVQEGRIQEYIENILMPEAKARGVDDIFGASGWPKDVEENQSED